MPQNLTFLYCLRNNHYQCSEELKNLIKNDVSYILEELLELRFIPLLYENNEILIGEIKLESAFHFVDHGFNVLTKSDCSSFKLGFFWIKLFHKDAWSIAL